MADSQPTHAVSGEQLNESTVEYRDIAGFPGYRVGNDGSVWSCRIGGSFRRAEMADSWHQLKPNILRQYRNGRPRPRYASVSVCRANKTHTRLVHILVLEAFVGPCPEGMECRHGDGDAANNRLNNLQWGTKEENCQDKRDHGTMTRGEKSHSAILNASAVLLSRQLWKEGRSIKSLAIEFGVHISTMCNAIHRKTWKHI